MTDLHLIVNQWAKSQSIAMKQAAGVKLGDVIEEPCLLCMGRGWLHDYPAGGADTECYSCNGRGYILTEVK